MPGLLDMPPFFMLIIGGIPLDGFIEDIPPIGAEDPIFFGILALFFATRLLRVGFFIMASFLRCGRSSLPDDQTLRLTALGCSGDLSL